MMKIYLLILTAFCLCNYSSAQSSSYSITDLIEKLKTLDLTKSEPLTLKKFASFNFAKFAVVDDETLAQEFEIGFSSTGQVREITYIGKSQFATKYKLLVFDSNDSRILILKHLVADKFLFTPIALITLKASQETYAVNFAKKFGKEDACCGPFYYSEFPSPDINNISAIMSLDREFFPTQIVQLSAMQVVISSDVFYENNKSPESRHTIKIKKETANFFLSPQYYTNLKINPLIPISQVMRSCRVPSDLVIDMMPNMHGFDSTPLWVFGAAVDYKKCVE